jgi:hypothetical protein
MMSSDRRMLTGAGKGLVAGAVGVAVMTLGEKVEQAFTHRPNSFVPAHTLERLLGLAITPDGQRRGFNLAMHWGQGIALGALRGVMAEGGLRGPWASAMFTVVRLTADQTQENITGVGAPPWTWPRNELLIDLLHKASMGSRPVWSLTGWRGRSRCGSKPAATAPTPSTIGEGPLSTRRMKQWLQSSPAGQRL